jgi:tetratricopeptide (TPR) repeat protein
MAAHGCASATGDSRIERAHVGTSMAKTPRRTAQAALDDAVRFDQRGREDDAIPLYREAIRRGLRGKALRNALIGLGSSLCTAGQHRAALRTLDRARNAFPDDVAVMMFLSYVHARAGQHKLSIRQLADVVVRNGLVEKSWERVLRQKFHQLR